MRFKVDENLPPSVVDDLRALGHEADTVIDEGLTGSTDPTLMAHVKLESRVLFTMDKGIANVRRYPPEDFAGIVLFRPRTTGLRATLALVRRHLPKLLQLNLSGRLVVASETSLRIR